ncbi:hypothetical protein ACFO0N_14920 [Halobium salinum]|uniref:Uncharacterized protein n=1 Tax=Halobium salinum TaxID=1364940 RepID=A0ABD5PEP5_9EURY|nr:hypothetical protein [Halobium salinum]
MNNEVAEETLTRYPDQFSTIRSLSTNLITVVGIFISLLGSGAFFGDTEINSLIIVAFASLVFALIIGFLALAEISGAVKEQEDGKILVGSKEWGSIWFSARYQLLLFIFSLITLISGIEL